MRMSEHNKHLLYQAISSEIMDLRVELRMNPELLNAEKIDEKLFKLERSVWAGVTTVLKIKDGINAAAVGE